MGRISEATIHGEGVFPEDYHKETAPVVGAEPVKEAEQEAEQEKAPESETKPEETPAPETKPEPKPEGANDGAGAKPLP